MADKIGSEPRQSIVLPVRPAIFNCDVPTLDIAGLVQTYAKSGSTACVRLQRSSAEKANHRHRRLLRARRHRPADRRAPGQRDELALVHSITSSARASSVGGTSRPSALAVLKLIASWYLVGAWTHRL